MWWRLALLGPMTGEFPSCAGGGSPNSSGSGSQESLRLLGDAPSLLLWGCVFGAVVLLALGLVYVSSVARFIFVDAVRTDRCRLRAGWRRWKDAAFSYFLWNLCLAVGFVAVLLAAVGVPIFLLGLVNALTEPSLVLTILLVGWLLIGVLGALIGSFVFFVVLVLAGDIIVPLVATQSITVIQAWRHLWLLAKGDLPNWGVYLAVRMVLGLLSLIVLGIMSLIVALLVVLLFAAVALGPVLGALTLGWSWNAWVLVPLLAYTAVAVLTVLVVMAVVTVPKAYFLTALALHFLDLRCPVLAPRLEATGPVRTVTPDGADEM